MENCKKKKWSHLQYKMIVTEVDFIGEFKSEMKIFVFDVQALITLSLFCVEAYVENWISAFLIISHFHIC